MDSKSLRELESYYTDVELHLFKSNKTFIEYLESIQEDELKEMNIKTSFTSLKKFIEVLKEVTLIKRSENVTRNKKVFDRVVDNVHYVAYELKGNQSFTKFAPYAKSKLNHKLIKHNGELTFFQISGLYLDSEVRLYALLAD